MDLRRITPPRRFAVGRGDVVLSHCADVDLEPDELLTLRTESGTEIDITRKDWGYCATPSLNRRLAEHGLRAALVLGQGPKAFVHLVERGQEAAHAAYLERERMTLIAWLDTDAAVGDAVRRLGEPTTGAESVP